MMLVALLGCAETDPDQVQHVEQDFPPFARELFAELRARPMADGPVEIGLFGDLNVLSGENVVMGRYRYRIDTTAGEQLASMAFMMRHAGQDVPVVLSFSPSSTGWQLEETRIVFRNVEEDTLDANLQAELRTWTSQAVSAAFD